MATAPIGIAPVFTPQTFRRLATWADTSNFPELAASFRELTPFVDGLVDHYFRPLSRIRTPSAFQRQFEAFAFRYEPFRVHLNSKLLGALAGQDVLGLYKRIFQESLLPLVDDAREMDLSPELIRSVVRDYFFIIDNLLRSAAQQPPPSRQGFEQLELVFDWVHAASKLDYGLTAVFLILERAITVSHLKVKLALMLACTASVMEFASATSRMFGLTPQALSRPLLHSTKFTFAELAAELRIESHSVERRGLSRRIPTPSLRRAEMEWLRRNTTQPGPYSGKWVVVEGDQLIASDQEYSKARAEAVRRGIERPFIVFVPQQEEGEFMGV